MSVDIGGSMPPYEPYEYQYTETNWQTDDIVSSVNLNKIENALAHRNECPFIVTMNQNGVLDKTWLEIEQASHERLVLLHTQVQVEQLENADVNMIFPLSFIGYDSNPRESISDRHYTVHFNRRSSDVENHKFYVSDQNDYPELFVELDT